MYRTEDVRTAVGRLQQQLRDWLVAAAFPLWSTNGCDAVRGGFHERLNERGEPLADSRRARVQARQIYSFALAPSFGWQGRSADLVAQGWRYFCERYRRLDGLFITLVDANGEALDSRVLLYDQAFALLALASAQAIGSLPCDVRSQAKELLGTIEVRFKRAEAGYETAIPASRPLQSNPHMHLLEAALEWRQRDDAEIWPALADSIGRLAQEKFMHRATLREYFDAEWRPQAGLSGRIVEPGHLFEWAGLLLRWNARALAVRQLALRLIDTGEKYGVVDGFAVNALLDDCSVHDGCARLWPQAERLKAAAAAARVTGDECYWKIARDAATGLLQYLQTPLPGLWYDRRSESGEFVAEPAPASTLYHIVSACAELRAATCREPG